MLKKSEPHTGDQHSSAVSAPSRGRASWTGILQVSLVAVPVKAYPAVSTTDTIRFNQLHADCGQRIRYEKHCPVHGKVDAAQIVKGYPYAPDQYVVVEDWELERLRPPKEKSLLLEQFVEAGEIDPVMLSGRTLYLFPDGLAAQRSYLLLAQAMQQRACCAVGRITMNGRRYGVVVRPLGRLLALHVLHARELVRSTSPWEAELPSTAASEEELNLACMLIDSASGKASPKPRKRRHHLFEIKWDGVRSLAAVEDVLRKLPHGTLVDGELVVLHEGRAELAAILRRHQLTNRFKTRLASRRTPVLYVVFDVLVHGGRSVMGKSLRERKEILAELLLPLDACQVVFSDGVVGAGKAMFEEVVRQGHEGVMAKHLSSRYLPGRRSSHWRKIKPQLFEGDRVK